MATLQCVQRKLKFRFAGDAGWVVGGDGGGGVALEPRFPGLGRASGNERRRLLGAELPSREEVRGSLSASRFRRGIAGPPPSKRITDETLCIPGALSRLRPVGSARTARFSQMQAWSKETVAEHAAWISW